MFNPWHNHNILDTSPQRNTTYIPFDHANAIISVEMGWEKNYNQLPSETQCFKYFPYRTVHENLNVDTVESQSY